MTGGDDARTEGPHADPDAFVRALVALGIPADEAEAAVAEDRVPLAIVARMGRREGPYTLEDVAARSGATLDLLREHCKALGIPEHATFDEAAIEDATLLARLTEFVDPDALVRVIRADGQALTRVALSHLELAHEQFVVPLRRSGGDDVAVAIALAEAHRALKGTASEIIRRGYDRILDQLLSTELVAAAPGRTGARGCSSRSAAPAWAHHGRWSALPLAGFRDSVKALLTESRNVSALRGYRPCWRRAARTVLCRSIVTVIGPTPPGTGVIAPATSATAS